MNSCNLSSCSPVTLTTRYTRTITIPPLFISYPLHTVSFPSFLYPCILVSLYPCILVSLYPCIRVFLYSCIPVFLYSCIPVFLYSCIHAFMHSCIPVFLYHYLYFSIPVSLYFCIPVSLYPFIPVSLNACISLPLIENIWEFDKVLILSSLCLFCLKQHNIIGIKSM